MKIKPDKVTDATLAAMHASMHPVRPEGLNVVTVATVETRWLVKWQPNGGGEARFLFADSTFQVPKDRLNEEPLRFRQRDDAETVRAGRAKWLTNDVVSLVPVKITRRRRRAPLSGGS